MKTIPQHRMPELIGVPNYFFGLAFATLAFVIFNWLSEEREMAWLGLCASFVSVVFYTFALAGREKNDSPHFDSFAIEMALALLAMNFCLQMYSLSVEGVFHPALAVGFSLGSLVTGGSVFKAHLVRE